MSLAEDAPAGAERVAQKPFGCVELGTIHQRRGEVVGGGQRRVMGVAERLAAALECAFEQDDALLGRAPFHEQ